MSDQGEEATEDNTFANKTFLLIDERFALNATSMLDQTNTSLREDFAARQMNLDLLSYQKTISLSSIESERTFSVTGFYF